MKHFTIYPLWGGIGILLLAFLTCRPAIDVARLVAACGQDRLVVVVAKNTTADLRAFERQNGVWREAFRAKGFVGRSGVSPGKREGDKVTPAGFFPMQRAFGLAKNPGAHLPYTVLEADDCWVDDPESRFYNLMVKKNGPGKEWRSAEDLPRETVAYKYAVVIEYNTAPVVKGAGSAIFLHCSTGRPTAGCVSVAEADMVRLLRFIRPGDRIVLAASMRDLRQY